MFTRWAFAILCIGNWHCMLCKTDICYQPTQIIYLIKFFKIKLSQCDTQKALTLIYFQFFISEICWISTMHIWLRKSTKFIFHALYTVKTCIWSMFSCSHINCRVLLYIKYVSFLNWNSFNLILIFFRNHSIYFKFSMKIQRKTVAWLWLDDERI